MNLVQWSPLAQNIFYMVATMSVYINHACNFFFYVLLNKQFRRLLWKKVRRVKETAPSSTHATTFRYVNSKSPAYESIKMAPIAGGFRVAIIA